jgi:tripartite-type tricarboxylate transporter receptor subunit TctC
MHVIRLFICLSLCIFLAWSGDVNAQTETWPTKSVRIIASAAPGGGVDLTARVLAKSLSQQLQYSFFVEDLGGAGGTIASNAVAKASPDGYTLLVCANAELTLAPFIRDNLPYNPVRDLVPVALVASSPTVIVVNRSVPATTMQELISYARTIGGMGYGTPGYGSIAHVTFDLVRSEKGLPFFHVPYKGGGPAAADVLSGQIKMAVVTLPPVGAFIESGLVRPLAVLQPTRSPMLPNVPTLKEAIGVDVPDASSWFGVMAPAKTPPEILKKLVQAISAANTTDVQATLRKQYLEPVFLTEGGFEKKFKEEFEANERSIKRIGIKPQ